MTPQEIFGFKVFTAPSWPKYKLPDDFPVTDEFRKDFDKWALDFFGLDSFVKEDEMLVIGSNILYMHLSAKRMVDEYLNSF